MPKDLKIILNPDPILRKTSAEIPLAEIGKPEFQELLADMERTVRDNDGAGFAAPQIGKNIRTVVIIDENRPYFLINPRIIKRSWARVVEEEGCLSVLDENGDIIYAPVKRHKKVTCVYYDQKGEQRKLKAEDMFARVIQHELDHLDGILFIDLVEDKDKPASLK